MTVELATTAFSLDEATKIFKEEEAYDKDGKLKDPIKTREYINKYFFPTTKGITIFGMQTQKNSNITIRKISRQSISISSPIK